MIIYHWELLVLLIGFVIGYIIYEKNYYRAGGVLAIPLLAIYTIKFPLISFYMILVSAVIYILIDLITNRYLLYGRRLLYISLGLGFAFLFIFINWISIDIGWYPMVIPGLIAYNIYKESKNTIDLVVSIRITIIYLILMFIIGGASLWLI